ncbi:MAG TPA: hypothetical protein VGG22_07045 [Candidatus Baltobacteraceae bacterium]|jgi:hypothetical protein
MQRARRRSALALIGIAGILLLPGTWMTLGFCAFVYFGTGAGWALVKAWEAHIEVGEARASLTEDAFQTAPSGSM